MTKITKPIGFFESMERSSNFDLESAKASEVWNRLNDLYEKNYVNKQNDGAAAIPKIIHQIWLGSPLPVNYKNLVESWKKFHPGWEHRLWTDKDAEAFPMRNRKIYDRLANNGAKSDLFRLEILYKCGGIYADTDFECLKNFGDICDKTDFFAGLVYDKQPTFANGLLGACVGNKIIGECIEEIGKTEVGVSKLSTEEIMNLTGPYLTTRVILKNTINPDCSIIPFPITFFYPFPSNSRFEKDAKKIRSFIGSESYAIHYWSASWVAKPTIIDKVVHLISVRIFNKNVNNK